MAKVLKIERKVAPKGRPEVPFGTPKGFKLADPRIGADRHFAEHAVFVKTLDEVADYLSRGYAPWMKQPQKRETLIRSASLRVIRHI
jgi:hypothetical protein